MLVSSRFLLLNTSVNASKCYIMFTTTTLLHAWQMLFLWHWHGPQLLPGTGQVDSAPLCAAGCKVDARDAPDALTPLLLAVGHAHAQPGMVHVCRHLLHRYTHCTLGRLLCQNALY